MTHHDAGHYSAKHGPDAVCQPEIADAVRAKANGQIISCVAAHQIAATLAVSPAEVGKTMDLLECRLMKCQLGLFGYQPEKKVVTPAATIADDLVRAIDEARGDNKRIACAACWRIAAELKTSKMTVSAACETLKIKIGPCQLGAF